MEEQARERRKEMEQIMEEREEKLVQVVEEIPLFRLFRKALEGMSEEALREHMMPEPKEDDICGWEELSGEEQMLVMEQWRAAYYPRDKEMLENRLRRMAWIAEPEEASLEEDWGERLIRGAVEKLLD